MRHPRLAPIGALLALVAVLACAGLTLAAATPVTADPCFGAGVRDPARHCDPDAFRLLVVPAPANARSPSRPSCAVEDRTAELFVCGYGTPRRTAVATVALLGDSHAAHWRPAVEAVALQRRWRVVSMSRAGCPVTLAVTKLPDADRGRDCLRWTRAVLRWLQRHRRVSVVFVSQHRARVLARTGHARQVRRNGYRNAWAWLLRHGVRHVVVIRDSPRDRPATQACVAGALAARRPAGPACAVPRSYALRPDPAVLAARSAGDTRVQAVDLSAVFCRGHFCLPVIGGALVHRDTEHMTRSFARTLAPFLGRAVDGLMASWADRQTLSSPVVSDPPVDGAALPRPPRPPASLSPAARSRAPRAPGAPARP